MSDEKKEPWLNWLALTTVIFAVCATLSTFKGGGHSTRSVMRQTQAANQWAYFQAKSTKQNLAEQSRDRLELDLLVLGPKGNPQVAEAFRARILANGADVDRYEREKQAISEKAKALEAEVGEAQKHGQAFGFAVIFLQIAILLSSIAALLKQKPVWWLGLAAGLVGLVSFANGFFLFLG